MVKLTQNIEAAFQAERTAGGGDSYGDPTPNASLIHLGLLDTFDPRSVEMNITPVASIGQSTEGFHAQGPIAVSVPIKVACQGTGTGWQELIGRAIGGTTITNPIPHALTNNVDSMALLVRDNSNSEFTAVSGVVPNEVTLEADYTTGGFITVDALCTGFFTEDGDGDANFTESNEFINVNYSSSDFPSAPSADPLLPTDLTVSAGLTATKGILNIDGPDTESYVEIGERYMRVFESDGTLDSSVGTSGIIDLASGNGATIGDGASAGATGGLTKILATDANWSGGPISSSNSLASTNLLKGIYNTNSARNILMADNMSTSFDNLKTVKLMIKNNNVPISGSTTRNSVTKFLANNKISRGLADITLEISMTAEDETFYDLYVAGTTIPLIRLDFGASYGSIALTNGTITAFSRPMSGAGEIVDTMTIKFRGAGDYKNNSAFAISADWTLNTT
tara:strand:- start:34 stop:1389 length:1356 start_codon:yes stop_codon:yes gene_type:complete